MALGKGVSLSGSAHDKEPLEAADLGPLTTDLHPPETVDAQVTLPEPSPALAPEPRPEVVYPEVLEPGPAPEPEVVAPEAPPLSPPVAIPVPTMEAPVPTEEVPTPVAEVVEPEASVVMPDAEPPPDAALPNNLATEQPTTEPVATGSDETVSGNPSPQSSMAAGVPEAAPSSCLTMADSGGEEAGVVPEPTPAVVAPPLSEPVAEVPEAVEAVGEPGTEEREPVPEPAVTPVSDPVGAT